MYYLPTKLEWLYCRLGTKKRSPIKGANRINLHLPYIEKSCPLFGICLSYVRAGLDYDEVVQWSRILGEWSNMIGYKLGSSLAKVYTMAKSSQAKIFEHEWKDDMAANMATLYARAILWRPSFSSNLKPLNKKLALQRIPTWGFSKIEIIIFCLHLVCHTNHCLK